MTRLLPFLAVALVGIGCQAKLTVAKSYKIPDDGEIAKILEMQAQPSAQTLTIGVKMKSGDAIDIFVLKADAIGDTYAKSTDEKKKWEAMALGAKRDTKDGTFTVKVPANTKYKVVIMQADSAKVASEFDLKVTN
jgi:hypothetical protein